MLIVYLFIVCSDTTTKCCFPFRATSSAIPPQSYNITVSISLCWQNDVCHASTKCFTWCLVSMHHLFLHAVNHNDAISIKSIRYQIKEYNHKRIQSSRMRTVRCSGRRGGALSAREGVCPRGVSAQGVCLPPMHAGIHPPVNRITDACENITLPQADGNNWIDSKYMRQSCCLTLYWQIINYIYSDPFSDNLNLINKKRVTKSFHHNGD